jgi:hypothetical protein
MSVLWLSICLGFRWGYEVEKENSAGFLNGGMREWRGGLITKPLKLINDKAIERPILVRAVWEVPPNYHRDLSLSHFLLSNLEGVNLAFDVHHDWRVHADRVDESLDTACFFENVT